MATDLVRQPNSLTEKRNQWAPNDYATELGDALTSARFGAHVVTGESFVLGDDDGVLFLPLDRAAGSFLSRSSHGLVEQGWIPPHTLDMYEDLTCRNSTEKHSADVSA